MQCFFPHIDAYYRQRFDHHNCSWPPLLRMWCTWSLPVWTESGHKRSTRPFRRSTYPLRDDHCTNSYRYSSGPFAKLCCLRTFSEDCSSVCSFCNCILYVILILATSVEQDVYLASNNRGNFILHFNDQL